MVGNAEKHLTILPVTMLGPARSGKTSLVYSFVQNHCPLIYVPSTDAELFYKTIDLTDVKCPAGHRIAQDVAGKDKARCLGCKEFFVEDEDVWRCQHEPSCGAVCRECWGKCREDQAFPVMVEIEDTFAWEPCDGGPDSADEFIRVSPRPKDDDDMPLLKMSSRFRNPELGTPRSEEFKHSKSSVQHLSSFMGMHSHTDTAPDGSFILNGFDPPCEEEYMPLVDDRLGFMIVFDCNSAKSWSVAKQIHEKFVSVRKPDEEIEPVVFIVANQIDKDISSHEAFRIREVAKDYVKVAAETQGLQRLSYEEVSATDFRKVKGMFRRMLFQMREIQDADTKRLATAQIRKSSGSWFGNSPTPSAREKDATKDSGVAPSPAPVARSKDAGETPKQDCTLQ